MTALAQSAVRSDAVAMMKAAYADTDWGARSFLPSNIPSFVSDNDDCTFYVDDDLVWMAVWVDRELTYCMASGDTWNTMGECGAAEVAFFEICETADTGLYFFDFTTGAYDIAVQRQVEETGQSPVVDPIAELTRRSKALVRQAQADDRDDDFVAKRAKLRAQLMVAEVRLAGVHQLLDEAGTLPA